MKQQKFYPVGVHSFSEMRSKNYLYVDKTEYIYQVTHNALKYILLNRPHGFGKSLLISTLKSYFEGRKDLFEGLAIEQYETEWTKYPVLHFDLSTAKNVTPEELRQALDQKLSVYEKIYGITDDTGIESIRLQELVREAYKQTGNHVVLLIDGHDSPYLEVTDEAQSAELQRILLSFFAPVKSCDPYLEYFFMTGITRYASPYLAGVLNNLWYACTDEDFATLCGITEEEILTQMSGDLDLLAEKMKVTRDEALAELKENYGGYRFAWPSPEIINPYSLMSTFANGEIGSDWFGGTMKPAHLTEILRKFEITLEKMSGYKAWGPSLNAPMEEMVYESTPHLYQNGYVTIKGHEHNIYSLDIPNKEVRTGLTEIFKQL